jgi:hypothetical protein
MTTRQDPQPGTRTRWPSKQARQIADAVRRDGGAIELTAKGHLRITGPDGVAIVPPGTGNGPGDRNLANIHATIRRETGLRIGPQTAKTGDPRAPKAKPKRTPTPLAELRGEITAWRPGHTSGFIKDEHGRSWFAPAASLPPGTRELPPGTPVTFQGRTTPRPGERYPDARNVRPEPPRK